MENLIDAMYGAIPGVITVLTTGLVGAALTFLWNLQLKRRELALASAKRFHELYGEFFALWKLWNYYVRDVEPGSFPTASRWNMLERACAAESGIEATLVELCTRRRLTTADIEDLGQFRQIYQKLRESIRDN